MDQRQIILNCMEQNVRNARTPAGRKFARKVLVDYQNAHPPCVPSLRPPCSPIRPVVPDWDRECADENFDSGDFDPYHSR